MIHLPMRSFTLLSCFLSMTGVASATSKFRGILQTKPIKAIFCDVDGTLTSGKDHTVSDRTFDSIKNIINNSDVLFFPATGRTRASMARVTHNRICDLFGAEEFTPGVYQQGLSVYKLDGSLLHSHLLPPNIIKYIENYCKQENLDVIAYCQDIAHSTTLSIHTDICAEYQDAAPSLVDKCTNLFNEASNLGIQKLIIVNRDPNRILEIKETLKKDMKLATLGAVVTQAVPEMCEILPPGQSKGYGVQRILNHLNIKNDECIAFGDGENDIEMFQTIPRSFAVSNARDLLKQSSAAICDSNENDGVASVLEELLDLKLSSV